VLVYSDFDGPFILSTDASLDGLDAVLSQVPAGKERARPIAFASKSFSRSQANYPAHRLEFLAFKWVVCDKFNHSLKGHRFTVWSDNNPLTYIMTKPKLDACEQHWVSKLAPYSFEIKHIPGKLNVVVDALSRDPFVRPLMSMMDLCRTPSASPASHSHWEVLLPPLPLMVHCLKMMSPLFSPLWTSGTLLLGSVQPLLLTTSPPWNLWARTCCLPCLSLTFSHASNSHLKG